MCSPGCCDRVTWLNPADWLAEWRHIASRSFACLIHQMRISSFPPDLQPVSGPFHFCPGVFWRQYYSSITQNLKYSRTISIAHLLYKMLFWLILMNCCYLLVAVMAKQTSSVHNGDLGPLRAFLVSLVCLCCCCCCSRKRSLWAASASHLWPITCFASPAV